jgi:hypothetical protein
MNLPMRRLQAALVAILLAGAWTGLHQATTSRQPNAKPVAAAATSAGQDEPAQATFRTAHGDPSWCGPLAAYVDTTFTASSHGDYVAKAAAGAREATKAAAVRALPARTHRYLTDLAAWERTYARTGGRSTAAGQQENARLFAAMGTDVLRPLSHRCKATMAGHSTHRP